MALLDMFVGFYDVGKGKDFVHGDTQAAGVDEPADVGELRAAGPDREEFSLGAEFCRLILWQSAGYGDQPAAFSRAAAKVR